MFQSFEVVTDPANGKPRLEALRAELKRRDLDGFLIPRADVHQGEYVAARDDRLAWLTGFTGSAGFAATLGDKAAIFVDGRYTIQAREQVDVGAFDHLSYPDPGLSGWLEENLQSGQKLGFDPWLHTLREKRQLEKLCKRAGAMLVAVDTNPLDAVWDDQPDGPSEPVELHPAELAGKPSSEKLMEIAGKLVKAGADACILTEPEAVAWTFNIRGHDLPHLPVALSFAIVHSDARAEIFIDAAKLGDDVRETLAGSADLFPVDAFENHLTALGKDGKAVLINPSRAASAIAMAITEAGGTLVEEGDPVEKLRAVKNEAEQQGSRAAHKRDGLAMIRFLAWLDREALSGGHDEISAARKLEELRTETGELRDISFDTISAFGPHAALPHYRVNSASNLEFEANAIYLVDSGAQYRDGTTDITRTIVFGMADADMRRTYTLVLKGHIAIDTVKFPKGTSGAQLDTLARYHLWQEGLDFDHGTGHGIGSYLSVHEGPQRISKLGSVALEPGMILSNEPGYYREGAFGIRLENLILVREADEVPGAERTLYDFETLTFTPFDRRLIDTALLSEDEIGWIDEYHATTREMFAGDLDDADRQWLEAATAPLER
ncbi:aminopeptidase P family protein [Tepidamorphus sp. 3E244]|uniref:aminopeptidase P family protein n=1 Tax=Tepidamorphus sp. 3E244 TaxID=3385498 RepID=UPI0038FCAF35